MPTAVEVYNDGGGLQFSSYAQLPVVAAKGTHSSATNYIAAGLAGWGTTRLDIACNEQAVVAIRPNGGGYFGVSYVEYVSGTRRIVYFCNGNAQSFDWWLFEHPNTVAAANAGFEIYADDGSLTWQLGQLPLRPASIMQMAINAGSLGDQSVIVPGGRNWAIVQGMRSGRRYFQNVPEPDGQPLRYSPRLAMDCARISGSTLTMGMVQVESTVVYYTDPAVYNTNTYFGPRNAIVVDVTNY